MTSIEEKTMTKCKFGMRCKNHTKKHLESFSHEKPFCKHGMNCELFKKEDESHLLLFVHEPVLCIFGTKCTNKTKEHLINYIHDGECDNGSQKIIPCKYGELCKLQSEKEHCKVFTHPEKKPVCPYGTACILPQLNPDHCLLFEHSDIKKMKKAKCPHGKECLISDGFHLSKYLHPVIVEQYV